MTPANWRVFLWGDLMFLKRGMFTHDGNTIELRELSALQRIEYLEYAAANQVTGDDGTDPMTYIAAANKLDIKLNALIVAMATIPIEKATDQDAVMEMQHVVMGSWSSSALVAAARLIMKLSGMLSPEPIENHGDVDSEELDAGKF
ncbi:phage tail assembly chaperone G [Edwardsiella tarda]|uniref:phage tail assembly chaperone G n=1 Tax=Edwardsiella tarda TaxID=636 RepID=UPI0034DD88EF